MYLNSDSKLCLCSELCEKIFNRNHVYICSFNEVFRVQECNVSYFPHINWLIEFIFMCHRVEWPEKRFYLNDFKDNFLMISILWFNFWKTMTIIYISVFFFKLKLCSYACSVFFTAIFIEVHYRYSYLIRSELMFAA